MEQVSAVKQPLNAGQPIVSQVVNSPNNQSCLLCCVAQTHSNGYGEEYGEGALCASLSCCCAVVVRWGRERERREMPLLLVSSPHQPPQHSNTHTTDPLPPGGNGFCGCLTPWQEWQTGKQGQHSAVMGFWGCPAVATPPSRASRLWGSGPPEELSFPPDGCSVGHGLA